jgi:putative colanic acid biosynthesis glycosyltransferase
MLVKLAGMDFLPWILRRYQMMKGVPLFSVITVTLNDRENFESTLKSVIRQRRTLGQGNIEYIVIDGGSGDGTLDAIRGAEEAIDRWVSEPDRGPCDALNKGVSLASGKYLSFLMAGDTYAEEDTLRKVQDSVYGSGHPDFIYGDSMDRSLNGHLLLKKARHHKWAWYGMFTRTPAMFFKREIVDRHRLTHCVEYSIACDYAFTVEFLDRGRTEKKVDFPVCTFLHGGREFRMAMAGLKEQWHIRRDVMNYNILTRSAISTVHMFSLGLRMYAFPIYSLLRYGDG